MSNTSPALLNRLGRRYKPDPDDAKFQMRSLVRTIDERTLPRHRYCYLPPKTFPLDQGNHPHCVGYATRGLLYAGPVVNRGGPDAVTIYHEAQMYDEWPGTNYDGTSARGAMKAMQRRGIIENYVNAWDVNTIRVWHLSTNRPTLLGINWYSSFWQTRRDGFIEIAPRATNDGGHEILTIGWDDVRGALRCMNSWGARYGYNGRFWIAGETLERLLREDGDSVTPIERHILS